jgi:uridine phosphorylase
MILCDFDTNKNSTFDPEEVVDVIPNFPKIACACFNKTLFNELLNGFDHEEIARIENENQDTLVYRLNYKGKDIAFFMARVGAPALIADMEHLIAMGAEKFLIFGCCGVLDSRINDLGIIIPTAAMRDEGCSYHYLEAADEIKVNTNKEHLKIFKNILKEHNYSYVEGKTWTTDAIFRETRSKVLKRKEAGCVCVDMECSAIFALMKFRNKEAFQFFYAADNLDAQKWDQRSLTGNKKIPEKAYIGLLAFEMAIKM